MTTEEDVQGAPGAGRTRRKPDPLQMTEVEKRMAEWEARHDVAARGRRASFDVVQHYCAHERLSQACPPRPAGARAPTARQRPRPAAEEPPWRLRDLFHRLI